MNASSSEDDSDQIQDLPDYSQDKIENLKILDQSENKSQIKQATASKDTESLIKNK